MFNLQLLRHISTLPKSGQLMRHGERSERANTRHQSADHASNFAVGSE